MYPINQISSENNSSFTYAHLADLHLGSWRDERMRKLSTDTFIKTIDECIEKEVDFILFAGDLFNTSLPSVDTLKIVTKKLKELNEKHVPLYVIAGSHDFSPSGKTMIDVLENAGLLINVCKGTVHPETKQLELNFTTDPKTQSKITGIIGRKGLLDRTYYENLNREHLEGQSGYKIFMFHTTLSELKPKHLEMLESQPASFLPKGCNYYAGGHIHHQTLINIPEYGPMTYTGALFPNNFSELEKYSHGGYYVVTVNGNEQNIEHHLIKIKNHHAVKIDCDHKSPIEIESELINLFEKTNLDDSVITIRCRGKISSGRVSDINFNQLFEQLYLKGAYMVMKNTTKLVSQEYEEIKVSQDCPDNIEDATIREHLGQLQMFDRDTELLLINSLLQVLNTEKGEGERVIDFQERMNHEIDHLIEE